MLDSKGRHTMYLKRRTHEAYIYEGINVHTHKLISEDTHIHINYIYEDIDICNT